MYDLQPDYIKDSTGVYPIAVASQTTVYTKSQKIGMGSNFGLSVLLASTNGTPSVKVEMQVSDNATAALEGVNDSVGATWCIQEGGTAIFANVNDKVLHKITINPTPSKYVRFKLTGLAGNQTDTTATLQLLSQQQLGR